MSVNKARKVYIDVIRIIGAFMVLYIHIGSFSAWEHEAMSLPTRIIYMLPATIAPSAVPLFMMISGCLLLSKRDSIKDIWTKRVAKAAMLILCVTILQCLYEKFYLGQDFSKFIYSLINLDDKNVVYWFLYWYLSFSIMLFCYQQIAQVLDTEHIIYISIFYIIFNTVLPVVNLVLSKAGFETLQFSKSLSLPLFVANGFFYPFLGYYIGNKCENNKVLKNTPLLVAIIFLCVIITMFLNLYFKVDGANVPARNYLTPIITVCIFQIIKNIFANINIAEDSKLYKLITFFGSNAIGIYVFQVLYSILVGPSTFNFIMKLIPIRKIAGIFNLTLAFVVMAVVTAIIKNLPIFKKALK